MPAILHIRLLGTFSLTYDAKPVTALSGPRLQSLLSFLVLHRDAPQLRQQIAFQFWSETTDAQAQTNLRQLLHALRHKLPASEQFLEVTPSTIRWNPDTHLRLDVAEFQAALVQAQQESGAERIPALARAADLYTGDLAPGCYEDWILPLREQLAVQFLDGLEQLIVMLDEQREYSAAIAYAQRLLIHDPFHEATYARLMQMHTVAGDRVAAIRVYHTCASILERELGVEPSLSIRELYNQLLHAEGAASPATPLRSEAPLVGRHHEWQTLKRVWSNVKEGVPHLLCLNGEAGIGKTRLAEELVRWAQQQGIIAIHTRAYRAEGELAYAPLSDALSRDPLKSQMARLEPLWLSEVARIYPALYLIRPDLPSPGLETDQGMTEPGRRKQLFEALAHTFLSQRQPTILMFDDLQWCDRGALEWLHYFLRYDGQAPLLVVGTVRPEEVDDQHPLTTLLLDLGRSGQVTEIELGPLSASEVAALAGQMADRDLDGEILKDLYQATEGNPLFVVETVRAVLSVREGESGGSVPSRPPNLPPKVQAVIHARLNQLSASTRDIAQLAATIGRAFTFKELAEVSSSTEEGLVLALDELWQRRIVREQGADSYDFSHDKLREVAYASISPVRRRRLHSQVAQALERLHAADLNDVSTRIAAHYRQAGEATKAAAYYCRAAYGMQFGIAPVETLAHLQQGLALLQSQLRSEENVTLEIAMHLAAGRLLTAHVGWGNPDTITAFEKARRLCIELNNWPQLLRVQDYLQMAYCDSGQFGQAHALAVDTLQLALRLDDPTEIEGAHGSLGLILLFVGDFIAAHKHLQQAAALAAASPSVQAGSRHPLAYTGAFPFALVQWLLGYVASARTYLQAVIAAQELSAKPYDLMTGYEFCVFFYHWQRDFETMYTYAQKLKSVTETYGFTTYQGLGELYIAAATSALGLPDVDSTVMRQSITELNAKGVCMHLPFELFLLAQVCGNNGQFDEAMTVLDESLSLADESGEYFWKAETVRLRGDLLVAQQCAPQAESAYEQALALARHQQSKSLELRAALSLSRLWQTQGKGRAARDLLTPLYAWFTEGYDSADLLEAMTLLDSLPK